MRMSIQNEMPGYNAVDQLLNQQGVGLTPAEMHGLISGILCGGNKDSSWQPLVHDLTNEGLAFGHELAQALRGQRKGEEAFLPPAIRWRMTVSYSSSTCRMATR